MVGRTWEIWFPDAGATGLPVARARIGSADVVWLHASPSRIAVTVREGDEAIIARGEPLERTGGSLPMTRLEVRGDGIVREDRWPDEGDIGAVVILPGGEAGTLVAWWNADDGSEWRWQLELHNRR